MIILAFDTCFNKSYIVLRNDNKIIEEKIIESSSENYHSAYLIPEIRNILKINNLFVKDIDVIGVNIGPGSFTGIRVGATIARVLAQQFNIKIVGVSSLEILSMLNITDKETIVALDARKGMVYFSQGTESGPKLISKEELLNCIHPEAFVISDSSIKNYLKDFGICSYNYEDTEENFAKLLSDTACKKLENGNANDFHWAKLKPLYIQKPSITKPKVIN